MNLKTTAKPGVKKPIKAGGKATGTGTMDLRINTALVDAVSPSFIQFNPRDVEWGDNLARVIGIMSYPPRVAVAWLAEVASMDGVVMKISAEPTEAATLVAALNRAVPELGSRLEQGKTSVKLSAERAYTDAQTLLRQIDQEQELVLKCVVTIMVYAADKEELDRRSKRVLSKLGAKRMKGVILVRNQEAGVLQTGPYGMSSTKIAEQLVQLLPASTLAAALPFATTGINDGGGTRLGRDTSGGIILLDLWTRGAGREDRTNVNWTVLGVPGVGKSTAVKHLLLQEWSQGSIVIIIDPEREYKDMCEYLGGQWVNAGGGGTKINPLQIKDAMERDDEETTAGMHPLDRHVQTLKTFFRLTLSDLTDLDMAYLEQAIMACYHKCEITRDTNVATLKNEQYPIMQDLYDELTNMAESAETNDKKKVITKLVALMQSMVGGGANAGLWNGHTNVWSQNDFVVYDTHDLQESDESTKRAQYFNVLTSCWKRLQENRQAGGRVLLAIDEAYLLVDPKVPQALNYLKQISKRIRKYGGGLAVISHTVNDFLDPAVRREGEALLENSCYKLLMGADGKNLEEMRTLYNLTEGQCELLAAKQRGRGLLIAGNKRTEAIIEVTDKELEIFGTGGGK
jgi:type IV secretory pathway VirB4 component